VQPNNLRLKFNHDNQYRSNFNNHLYRKTIHQYSSRFLWENAALDAEAATTVGQLQKLVNVVTIAATQSNNLGQVLVKVL
jgi:hypothetical protein